MIWQLKDNGVRRPHDLPDHIERRLRSALGRFVGRIQKVFVFLHDLNGPKGGVDKLCRILVKTRSLGVVVVAVADSDWFVAVDRATTRVGQSVATHVERLRNHRAERLSRLRIARLAGGRPI